MKANVDVMQLKVTDVVTQLYDVLRRSTVFHAWTRHAGGVPAPIARGILMG
jgi:hypothetical protein